MKSSKGTGIEDALSHRASDVPGTDGSEYLAVRIEQRFAGERIVEADTKAGAVEGALVFAECSGEIRKKIGASLADPGFSLCNAQSRGFGAGTFVSSESRRTAQGNDDGFLADERFSGREKQAQHRGQAESNAGKLHSVEFLLAG